jgi:LysM repeat protein
VLKIVAPNAAPPQPTAVSQPAPTQAQQSQQPQQPQQPKPATYTVQSGDTLTGVASRFGLTREALAAANGISPSSYLYVGQVLKIPSGNQPTQASVPTTTPQPAGSPAAVEPGKPVTYVVQAGDNLASIAAKFNTTVAALIQLNNLPDANFVYSGQVLTIIKGNDQANDVPSNTPVPEPTPPMGQFGPKWIDVSLGTQTMVAYEGTVPVFTAKISSGVPAHPTVIGIYRVYAKYTSTRMHGGTPGVDYYDIPNVPWTMYFYADYALHGAYWHNNFGHPMSHGCVNLSVDVSKWLYNWAPVGTLVVTHK